MNKLTSLQNQNLSLMRYFAEKNFSAIRQKQNFSLMGLVCGEENNLSKSNNNLDTINISTKAKDSLIENAMQSGEPLKGIRREDYENYYYRQNGYSPKKELYNQLVKGRNDIVKDREWLNNPNFVITDDVRNTAEYKEDFFKIMDKYSENKELNYQENKILNGLIDQSDVQTLVARAKVSRNTIRNENFISSALNNAGITLGEDEKFKFKVSPVSSEFIVSGDLPEEKLKGIEKALNEMDLTKYGYSSSSVPFVSAYNFETSNFHKEFRQNMVISEYLNDAQNFLTKYSGGDVKLQDLSFDENGEIIGLNDKMKEVLSEVTVSPSTYLSKHKSVLPEREPDTAENTEANFAMLALKVSIDELKSGNIEKYNGIESFTYEYSSDSDEKLTIFI
ncbi:MAG: hypothetical protein LBL93_04710 [Ruminococcus sp.]|jgi:hypothetical protein|nr:hypothetical protein [Ruminococcus sp.]